MTLIVDANNGLQPPAAAGKILEKNYLKNKNFFLNKTLRFTAKIFRKGGKILVFLVFSGPKCRNQVFSGFSGL